MHQSGYLYNKIYLLTFILGSLFYTGIPQLYAFDDTIKTGLYFHSFEVDKDKRTGLNLTPQKSLVLPHGFSMEFEIKFRTEMQAFGYIFRIVGDNQSNVDLISHQFNPERFFSLTSKNGLLIPYSKEELAENITDDWIKVRITFKPDNRLLLSINDQEKETDYPVNAIKKYQIWFGKNESIDFNTTDVAPIRLRNIRIRNHKNELVRQWSLGKHAGNKVFDECKNQKAVVVNPSWEIDKHVHWQKRKVFQLPGQYYQFAFDNEGNRIFIVRDDRIFIYHTLTGETDIIHTTGFPYNTEPNQLVYATGRNELLSYDYEKDFLSCFNFDTGEWSNTNYEHIPTRFWHHGSYYLPHDSSIITLGGYGQHTYSNLLQKYRIAEQGWEKTEPAGNFYPRYLGSMGGMDNNSILYFGGYGNESGNQEQGAVNFYQLYKVDLEKKSVHMMWELPSVEEHFTNSKSMVIDTAKNVFYSLRYPNDKHAGYILLTEYKLDKPEFRTLGDTLLYLFNDIDSFCDLYQSNNKEELYALTSEVKDNNSEISIYSIAYPPLTLSEITQKATNPFKNIFLYIFSLLFVLLLIAISWLYYKKAGNKKKTTRQIIPVSESEPKENYELIDQPELSSSVLLPSSINLLGKFRVISKTGDEIKENFSPKTQQFFVLILLSTLKDENGITAEEINKHFWEDKDDISARNNRNVYIKKIRGILNEMEGLELVKQNGYWKLKIDKSVFCDYARVLSITNFIKNQKEINSNLLNELLNTASRGTLLSLMEAEWLDKFKADFSDLLIESLTDISKNKTCITDLNLLLRIADIILQHDNTEEYGIKLKCSVLLRLKKNALARQSYLKFVDDYQKLLGIQPDFTFEDILNFNVDNY